MDHPKPLRKGTYFGSLSLYDITFNTFFDFGIGCN